MLFECCKTINVQQVPTGESARPLKQLWIINNLKLKKKPFSNCILILDKRVSNQLLAKNEVYTYIFSVKLSIEFFLKWIILNERMYGKR